MNSPFLFVSYFTDDAYEELSETLAASLEKFSLPYSIVRVPDMGAWHHNTKFKPVFLIKMLEENRDRDIIWVDCDCVIEKFPDLLVSPPGEHPLSAHVWRHSSSGNPEIWSSVLRIKNTERSIAILDNWDILNLMDKSERFCDPNLWECLKPGDLFELPAGYAWVEYMMRATYPTEEPIIRHGRVSRPMWERSP